MLGITIDHLTQFSLVSEWKSHDSLSKETPGLYTFLRGIGQSWHLALFFLSAGYLDSQYRSNLGATDIAMYLLVVLLPLGEGHPFFGSKVFSGWEHPARWFLFCLVVCRLHMVFQKKYQVPKFLFLIIAVFSSNILEYLVKASQAVTYSNPVTLLGLLTKVFFRIDQTWFKFVEGIVVYMTGAMWLPDLARFAATKGPRSLRGEKILGLMLWLCFCLFMVKLSLNAYYVDDPLPDLWVYWKEGLTITTIQPYVWPSPWKVPDVTFLVPFSIMYTVFKVCLLAAAIAYLPLALPDIFLNACFGAFLLIPLTFNLSFQYWTGYCLFEMQQNAFVRIFLFLCCYSIYFAGCGYTFQMFLGRAMTATVAGATKLYQWLAPTDN
jgi:hypothetical protein